MFERRRFEWCNCTEGYECIQAGAKHREGCPVMAERKERRKNEKRDQELGTVGGVGGEDGAGGGRAVINVNVKVGPVVKLSSLAEVGTWKTKALKTAGIVSRARIGAWTIALSRDTVVTDLHHFSASLTDPRSSTEADWQLLGQITSTVGTPADPMRPLAETPPGAVMHWSWRAPPPEDE